MSHTCSALERLWTEVAMLNKQHFPHNSLMPILGGGKTSKPKVMFVFINPTARNQSAHPDWNGPRFPFIGTRGIWRIFHRAGLFDDELLQYINTNPTWSVAFTHRVLSFLQARGFYLTNIVKWTGADAALPDARKLELFLPLLKKEIEIVQPERIVTFGLIPFTALTKQKLKLSEYYDEAMRQKQLKSYDLTIGSTASKVIPCYFPVGRGDPRKAVEILKLICSRTP